MCEVAGDFAGGLEKQVLCELAIFVTTGSSLQLLEH